jgi:acetyl esterase
MLLSGFAMYGGSQEQLKNTPELNLLDADLSNLPATTIITAEFDPLRDEGEMLYKKLLSYGVDAYCQRYLGVIHGFYQLSAISGSARKCIEQIALEIKQ